MERPTEHIAILHGYIRLFEEQQTIERFPIATAIHEVLAYLDEMERTLPEPPTERKGERHDS